MTMKYNGERAGSLIINITRVRKAQFFLSKSFGRSSPSRTNYNRNCKQNNGKYALLLWLCLAPGERVNSVASVPIISLDARHLSSLRLAVCVCACFVYDSKQPKSRAMNLSHIFKDFHPA